MSIEAYEQLVGRAELYALIREGLNDVEQENVFKLLKNQIILKKYNSGVYFFRQEIRYIQLFFLYIISL